MQASASVGPYETAGVVTGRLGMWWVLASEIVIFGGAVVIYLLYRLRYPEWAAESAHTNELIGLANTVILLTSSLTMVLAHQAATPERRARCSRLLGATVLLGAAFLGLKAYEYRSELLAGFTPTKNLFWSFYYFLTGLHALHIVAGLIAILAVRRGVRRGENFQRVDHVGLYWHFVDVVWIFLFPMLYLAGRAG
ncbi:MAG TPA: cytochrome c oxidase subunit 3 [bacterium]|nr:cytochrome c oxidase subunit 3 [bacterium]